MSGDISVARLVAAHSLVVIHVSAVYLYVVHVV